jgi:hypothetical protein
LEAIATALTGYTLDYRSLEPLGPEAFAAVLEARDLAYRRRIVHHMVLGELVLRPIPVEVAHRVATYAEAIGIADDFVRVSRRYAQGAYGLAWMDLQRNGFVEHVIEADGADEHGTGSTKDPFESATLDTELTERWLAFADLPEGSLGRSVWEMYDARGFGLPGSPGGAPVYLAQHDFVHVLADYGTNLKGEIEVFGFIGRADPSPKGFAWLATLIGLFETGYITTTGFFDRSREGGSLREPGMPLRVSDAIRRGKAVCGRLSMDLFDVDYYELAGRPVEEVRRQLAIPSKSSGAIEGGSFSLVDPRGMSERQRRFYLERRR